MPAYLVTGGAGFIGSHIVEALCRKGCAVTVLDNFSTGKFENIEGVADRIRLIRGDIRDRGAIEEALAGGIDAVFHQAAIASVVRSFEDPASTLSVNLTGTALLLEACRAAGVRKVIFASSSSVYGDSPTLPKEEGMVPAPKSPYAISKLGCEMLMRMYAEVYGMETVCLRYFNVFGPRQDPASEYAAVIPRFVAAMLEGKPPIIFGDGLQTRDFCYIDNVVSANLLCIEKSGLRGDIFNVACGERMTLLQLLSILRSMIPWSGEPLFEGPRPGDVRDSLASIERAKRILGFQVLVPTTEGLARTVAYFKNRQISSV